MKVLTLVLGGLICTAAALTILLVAGRDSANAAPGDTTADRVYGQNGAFNSNACNFGGLSAASICTPDGVYIDAAGRMYIADSANNRVLMYPNTLNNVSATKVFGQYNLFNVNPCNNGGINVNTMCSPSEVTGDPLGNIYIADLLNSRVLEFDDPNGSCGTCDTVADRVFGQLGSFTTGIINKGGISANSLNYPEGVVTDSAGNLYVSDRLNSRVLEFNNPVGSCGSCDTTADKVFGQLGSFTTNTKNNGGVSANSLDYTLGLGIDGSNNLYVADEQNNRVLEYNNPMGSCGSCDTTADLVFGQLNLFTTNFANNNAGTSATALYVPTDVTVDTAGNVYISETGNERTLEYNQAVQHRHRRRCRLRAGRKLHLEHQQQHRPEREQPGRPVVACLRPGLQPVHRRLRQQPHARVRRTAAELHRPADPDGHRHAERDTDQLSDRAVHRDADRHGYTDADRHAYLRLAHPRWV